MLRIIGFLFGTVFFIFFLFYDLDDSCAIFSTRTRQEEVRSQMLQESTSFYMSTDFCLYVQVGLIAALVVFGISR